MSAAMDSNAPLKDPVAIARYLSRDRVPGAGCLDERNLFRESDNVIRSEFASTWKRLESGDPSDLYLTEMAKIERKKK